MYGLSVKFPLQRGEQDGYYKLNKNYQEMIAQNLKNLLLTTPGERVMDPEFGVGIRDLLFEPDDEMVKGRLNSRVRSQVRTYLPMLDIEEVNVSNPRGSSGSPDGQVLYVSVRANIRPLDQSIVVPVEVENYI